MQRRFKLQKVLEYRNLMLEKEKAQLAQLILEERALIAAIKAYRDEILLKREELDTVHRAGDFAYASMYENYIASLEKLRAAEQQKLALHRQTMYRQKGKTVTAYKRKTVMDKLKDRHDTAYSKYADTLETKSQEDIVLTRIASKIND